MSFFLPPQLLGSHNPRHPLLSDLTMHYSTTNKSCCCSILWHTIHSEFNLLQRIYRIEAKRGRNRVLCSANHFLVTGWMVKKWIQAIGQTHYWGKHSESVIECTRSGQINASIGILYRPFHNVNGKSDCTRKMLIVTNISPHTRKIIQIHNISSLPVSTHRADWIDFDWIGLGFEVGRAALA